MAINKYPNLAISETNTSGKYFGKNNSKLAGGQTTDNDANTSSGVSDIT